MSRYMVYGGGATLLFVAIGCIFFAPLGLNPTDSGLTLAIVRRILDGQVPYRDFVWMRPMGSELLHVPAVLFGGDYAIIIGRYTGIIQDGVSIWLLMEILRKEACPRIPRNQFLALLLIAQCFSSTTIMFDPYYTRDAYFLCAVGMFLAYEGCITRRCIGHLLIGAACLAKQNFALIIPAALLFFRSWRDIRLMISILLPGLLFILYLVANEIFREAYLQITALKGLFFDRAVRLLTLPYTVAGFAAGLVARRKTKWTAAVLAISLPGIIAVGTFHEAIALKYGFPFGVLLGLVAGSWLLGKQEKHTPYLWFLLFLGWVIAFAEGFPYPQFVYALYIIIPYVLIVVNDNESKVGKMRIGGKDMRLALPAVLLLISIFVHANDRLNHQYRTKHYSFLTAPMAGKFPGAGGIVASPAMAYAYKQMNEMIEFARSQGRQYSILPQMPLYWAKSPQANPLPVDWPYIVELGNSPALVKRINDAADNLRPQALFILQKFNLEEIDRDSPGLLRLGGGPVYPVYEHIKSNYRLVTTNDLFEVYE